jgi:hypothetical protein
LTATRVVHPLQQSVVASGRHTQHIIVGQSFGPIAADHVNREVLINHDHGERTSRLVVGRLIAAEDRVGGQIGVERGLELVGQVASGDAPAERAALRGKPRIPRTATATSFLEQVLTDSHCTSLADASDQVVAPAGAISRDEL